MQIEMIADFSCHTGENPLWHAAEGRLYWVDIPAGRLFRYDPATGRSEQFAAGAAVGGFTLQPDGDLLLFMARGGIRTWRNGRLRATVVEALPEEMDNRFNDVIADPEGRVFCGVMSTPRRAGRLYRLESDNSLHTLLEGIGTSNGMGFTPDLGRMYHTDSRKQEIHMFDYDRETGAIANRRLFARAPDGDGHPDGLTVDSEGCVWSARWDGSCVVRYSPDGREIGRLAFPAKKVSSVTFGGQDYGDLYVTTAGGDNKTENGPGAGALFRARPGVRGVPEFFSRIRIADERSEQQT